MRHMRGNGGDMTTPCGNSATVTRATLTVPVRAVKRFTVLFHKSILGPVAVSGRAQGGRTVPAHQLPDDVLLWIGVEPTQARQMRRVTIPDLTCTDFAALTPEAIPGFVRRTLRRGGYETYLTACIEVTVRQDTREVVRISCDVGDCEGVSEYYPADTPEATLEKYARQAVNYATDLEYEGGWVRQGEA
jgi:hypothetical protein